MCLFICLLSRYEIISTRKYASRYKRLQKKKITIEKLIHSRKGALDILATSIKKDIDLSVKFELIFCIHIEKIVTEQWTSKELKNNETVNEINIIEYSNNKNCYEKSESNNKVDVGNLLISNNIYDPGI